MKFHVHEPDQMPSFDGPVSLAFTVKDMQPLLTLKPLEKGLLWEGKQIKGVDRIQRTNKS